MKSKDNNKQKEIKTELKSFLEGFKSSEYTETEWQNSDGMYHQYSAFIENKTCPMGSISVL